jgi:hypothetical protein
LIASASAWLGFLNSAAVRALPEFHAGEIGGVVHGDNSGQVIAHGLRFRGQDHLSANLQGQYLFFCELGDRGAGSNSIVPNSSPQAMAMRMVISSSASMYSRVEA